MVQQMPQFELPRDYTSVSESKSSAGYGYLLTGDTRDRLKQLAEKYNTSLFSVMFSLFDILLARISGQEDIVVGVPVLGRNHSSLYPLVGFFVNTAVFHQHVDYQQRFSDFLHQVNGDVMETLNHQSYPLEKVLDDLKMKFPRINVFFNMFGEIFLKLEEESEVLEPVHLEEVIDAKFSLVLYVAEYRNGIEIECHYWKTYYKPDNIASMVKNYSSIINFFTGNPDKIIGDYKARGKRRSLKPV